VRHRIHVPLLSDPTIYRESDARAAGEGRFRLLADARSAETLRFAAGEIVDCEIVTLPDGSKGLVAVRSVSADPEYRSRRTVFGVSGAIVGAIFGAAVVLTFEASPIAASVASVVGAAIFAFCSVRWGDSAWDVLIRLLSD
jgi:hypothetical protein